MVIMYNNALQSSNALAGTKRTTTMMPRNDNNGGNHTELSATRQVYRVTFGPSNI